MSQTHHCQTCGRAVIIMGDGTIVRSCLKHASNADCHEPVAAKLEATCYSIGALRAMTSEERARIGM